jgi:NitT/TauT family transport system ATP-binding protein
VEGAFVEFRGVSKTFFPGGRPPVEALAPTNLSIPEGQFTSVVGPSGCGKSTLLAILGGLEAPTTGEARIAGQPVRAPYSDLGVAFQKDLLLEWRTVLDNVLLQIELRGQDRRRHLQRAYELLQMVGLDGFAKHYPHELSGGMRQRVAVCRALVHDPRLLLMDEPFAALDALTRDQMALDFQHLTVTRGKTILFVTHSISEAIFLADSVVVFSPRPGRIVESISVDLPRPRRLADRERPAFTAYVARIREIFERQGTLREE